MRHFIYDSSRKASAAVSDLLGTGLAFQVGRRSGGISITVGGRPPEWMAEDCDRFEDDDEKPEPEVEDRAIVTVQQRVLTYRGVHKDETDSSLTDNEPDDIESDEFVVVPKGYVVLLANGAAINESHHAGFCVEMGRTHRIIVDRRGEE